MTNQAVVAIVEAFVKHLPSKHNQKTHGHGNESSASSPIPTDEIISKRLSLLSERSRRGIQLIDVKNILKRKDLVGYKNSKWFAVSSLPSKYASDFGKKHFDANVASDDFFGAVRDVVDASEYVPESLR